MSQPGGMVILVEDAQRHRLLSGYGALARHLILGLDDRGHKVVIRSGKTPWADVGGATRKRITELSDHSALQRDPDVVLQICSPGGCQTFDVPSAIYTQNALGGLRAEWAQSLLQADHCIVPGEFDRRVFSRHVPSVSIAPQGSNPSTFKSRPSWREEGSERFTFMFVGGYGFRKGVDVLLAAFLQEFHRSEPVELWLFCVGMGDNFNHLLEAMHDPNQQARRSRGYFNDVARAVRGRRQPINIRVSTRAVSPSWMCRHYNRADCVVTATRGEGWCMPITEALLCEKPVIAPRSTAPGEYLDDETAYLVPVTETAAADISDPFGEGFRKQYGEPGITYFEPDIDQLRRMMRHVYSNRDEAASKAVKGAVMVRERYDWRSAAEQVEVALEGVASAKSAGPRQVV